MRFDRRSLRDNGVHLQGVSSENQVQPVDHQTAKFLRAVARPQRLVSTEAIYHLGSGIACWNDVIVAAVQHGILPLIYPRLLEIQDTVPSEVIDIARCEYERNAFHCITNAEELLQVSSAFDKAGISAMPFKGVALGASAYGEMTRRRAGDLDLLIHYCDLRLATAILLQRGYELKTKTLADGSPEAEDYFEFHFERPTDGMVLELRWRLELSQPRYQSEIGLEWVWNRRRMQTLAGVPVPAPDPASSLLILCMHGSKHSWSRWMWVCDVAMLIESEPDLDWTFSEREAKRVGLERCFALGVLLAWRAADVRVPPQVLRKLKAYKGMDRLSEFFLESLMENPGGTPPGTLPYFVRILGFRDRMRCLLSPSILRPNERDRTAVRLPKFLSPLYYLVRPLRVLTDRSMR